MAALSERKIEIVRTLVESAPDRVVGSLQQALSGTSDASALGGVRRLVEGEVAERNLRNQVLAPVAAMFVGAGDHPHTLTFPARVLPLLWRGLRETQDAKIEEVRTVLADAGHPHLLTDAFEALTRAAAQGVRDRDIDAFRKAAEACDAARPGGADLLAGCLELAPIVRRASERMPEWMTRQGSETTAAARLAFKDAVQVAEDAGPRFFQMLAAQLPHPWMVLRIISAVMDKPTERYLADSELGGFGEQVMDDVDQLLGDVSRLDPDAGPEAGRAAAGWVELAVQQIQELEDSIDLSRDHGWGQRLHKQRMELAATVERRLRAAEKATIEALPTQRTRAHRAARPAPCLDEPPEPRLVRRATTLLSFADAVQVTANHGGFTSARAKLVETLGAHIDHYVEEIVDRVRLDEVADREIAAAFLNVAADFNQLVCGGKAGDLVRRRAHAALHPEAATSEER
jgi:hypothetical protein